MLLYVCFAEFSHFFVVFWLSNWNNLAHNSIEATNVGHCAVIKRANLLTKKKKKADIKESHNVHLHLMHIYFGLLIVTVTRQCVVSFRCLLLVAIFWAQRQCSVWKLQMRRKLCYGIFYVSIRTYCVCRLCRWPGGRPGKTGGNIYHTGNTWAMHLTSIVSLKEGNVAFHRCDSGTILSACGMMLMFSAELRAPCHVMFLVFSGVNTS